MYGGSFNAASVIGKFGNPYQDYLAAFGLPLPNDALNLIPVTGNTAINAPVPSGYGSSIPDSMAVTGQVDNARKVETRHASQAQSITQRSHATPGPVTPPQKTASQHQRRTSTMTRMIQNGGDSRDREHPARGKLTDTNEEGFMDVLRVVASALPTGLGLIGGGPIGALAGFALNAASKIITETTDEESAIDAPWVPEFSMERAILAEATLSALQSAEMHPDLEESIFSDIKDTVMKALPVIRKAAPHVMGTMMEPALKIALDSLHSYNQKVSSGAESFEVGSSEPFRPNVLYSSAIDQPADRQAEAFLGHLHTAMRQNLQESAMDGDSEEGFIDILTVGCRYASKGVLAAAKHGLPVLVDALQKAGSAESIEDQSSSGPSAHLLAADPLAQRALVADAALRAVMKLPPQQLQEEGFFTSIGNAIKIIAPIAMKVAPVVAGAIHPAIGKVVSAVLKQESTFADQGSILTGSRPRLPGSHGLSTRHSLFSLRDASTHQSEKHNRFQQSGTNGSRHQARNRLGA